MANMDRGSMECPNLNCIVGADAHSAAGHALDFFEMAFDYPGKTAPCTDAPLIASVGEAGNGAIGSGYSRTGFGTGSRIAAASQRQQSYDPRSGKRPR
jgi:hypothetical protein